jgi:phage terminase small subunit
MAGRRPKPTALHRLEGTFNATRHGKGRAREPMPQGDLDAAPAWFTDSQREGWDYAIAHAPRGLLKMIDRGMLGVWVLAEDRLRVAEITQQRLNEHSPDLPLLIRGPQGLEVSPYVAIADKMSKTMMQAADRLGFSPVARPRLQLDPPDEPDKGGGAWGTLRRFPVIPGGKT